MTVQSKWYRATLLLISLSVLALLISSPIVGHDSWLHLIWLEQFAGLIKEGVLYPRWLPLSNGGFGSPTFYFYPPLAAYLGSLAAVLSPVAREVDLFRFVGYIGTIGSIFTFRYYLKTLDVDRSLTWFGGVLYAVLPYRAVDLVLRNALGEHLAFVWVPLVFAGIEKLNASSSKERRKAVILIAVGFALLLLTNIPTSVAIAVAAVIYTFIRHNKHVRPLGMSIVGLFFGGLLVSFYLLPAISLQSHIQSFHLWDAGTSRTGSAYLLTEIFTKDPNPVTNGNLVVLLAGVVTLVVSVLVLRHTKVNGYSNKDRILLACAVLIGIVLILQIPSITSFLYNLPGIQYIQFSWRWNILLVPAVSTALVLLYSSRPPLVLGMSIVFAVTTVLIVTSFNAKYEYHHSPDLLKEEYSDAFEYMPETTLQRTHAIAKFVAAQRNDPPVTIDGPGTAALIGKEGDRREFQFDLSYPAKATFHLFYWPLWEARIDGNALRMSPDSLGRATALIHAGNHRVTIDRATHTSEKIGGWMSIGACILLLIGVIYSGLKPVKKL